ncbi:hypothetical protein ALC56_00085, partial [Trachymyrmex septentrionalis]
SLATISHEYGPQLLTSAMVYIRNRRHNFAKCRALLDICATANFISETILRQLNVNVIKHSLFVGMINTMNTMSGVIVLPSIVDLIPSEIFSRNAIEVLSNVQLMDPKFPLIC